MKIESPHKVIVNGRCERCGLPVYDPDDLSKAKYLCMTPEEWDEAMQDLVPNNKRSEAEEFER